MDKRLKILIAAAVILIIAGVVGGIVTYRQDATAGVPRLKLSETNYDFGVVAMSQGIVSHTFKIKNEGQGDLRLSGISTSCMCTTAVLKVGEETSPVFGLHNNPLVWSKKIVPGATADLIVSFDPNAHGPEATGPITRTVSFYSNNGGEEQAKTVILFTADVVK